MTADEDASCNWDIQAIIAGAEEFGEFLEKAVAAAGIQFRQSGFGRTFDQVAASHANRIFLGHRSVLSLARTGAFQDACVLSRVAIEHFVSFAFIDAQADRHAAGYGFVVDGYSHETEKFESLREHYPDDFMPDAEQVKRQEAWKAYVEWLNYQSRFMQQIDFLDRASESDDRVNRKTMFGYLRDFAYSDFSLFVHPRSAGLGLFVPSGEMFAIEQPTNALLMAKAVFWSAFSCAAACVILQSYAPSLTEPFAMFDRLQTKTNLRSAAAAALGGHLMPFLDGVNVPRGKKQRGK